MVYVFEGNLYLQDGSEPPLQLTTSAEVHDPIFSDDGEKIAFLRGGVPHDLYVVNADGNGEQELVSASRLAALRLEYDDLSEIIHFRFVPGTHRLLFNTRQLDPWSIEVQDVHRLGSKRNEDLLIIDAETGQVEILFPPGEGGGFSVSPDGSLVALNKSGRVDIATIEGQVILPELVTHTPTEPMELYAGIDWLPDSTGLIVTLPADDYYDMEDPENRTVWRYPLDGRPPHLVPLDTPVKGLYEVSPDRNWILYGYIDHTEPVIEFYLGDLRNGFTQNVNLLATEAFYWCPDSIHFVLSGAGEFYLGSVDGSLKLIDQGRFLGWVDASRFLYYPKLDGGSLTMGEIGGGGRPILVGEPGSSLLGSLGWLRFVLLDLKGNFKD